MPANSNISCILTLASKCSLVFFVLHEMRPPSEETAPQPSWLLFLFSQLTYHKLGGGGHGWLIPHFYFQIMSCPSSLKNHISFEVHAVRLHLFTTSHYNWSHCMSSSMEFSKGHYLPLSSSLLTDFFHVEHSPNTLNIQFLDYLPHFQQILSLF